MLWLCLTEVVFDGAMKTCDPVGEGGNKGNELWWFCVVCVLWL